MNKLKQLLLTFLGLAPLLSFSQDSISKVDKLLYVGKFDKAEKVIKQTFGNDTVNLGYLYYMGEVSRDKGNYDEAMSYFNNALAHNPKSAVVVQCIAITYAQRGDTAEALKQINRAIALDSTKANYYNTRGGIYLLTQNYRQALHDYQQAYRLNPHSYKIQYNLGLVYCDMENYIDAVTYISKSLETHKDRLAYYELGYSYYQMDKDKEAIDNYSNALKLEHSTNPYEDISDGQLYYWRSLAWKDLGDSVKSKQDMNQASKLDYKE